MVGLGSESVRGNMKHVVVVGGGSGARMGGRGEGGMFLFIRSVQSIRYFLFLFFFFLFFPLFYFYGVGLGEEVVLGWGAGGRGACFSLFAQCSLSDISFFSSSSFFFFFLFFFFFSFFNFFLWVGFASVLGLAYILSFLFFQKKILKVAASI